MDEPTPRLHRFFMWLRCLICEDSRNFTQQLKTIRKAAQMDDLSEDPRIKDVHLPQKASDRMKAVIAKELEQSR